MTISIGESPASSPVIALQGLTPQSLASRFPTIPMPEVHRIVSAVQRGRPLTGHVRHVRRESLEMVHAAGGRVPSLQLRCRAQSALDPFVKLALETPDGRFLETVRIPLERPGRFSVCVSSQVGCALACDFCATGRLGLTRNLESWEIVEQVRVVRGTLDRLAGERVHGVVFQGMGEPLANLDHVLEAIGVCCHPSALAIRGRNITVCTAGLPDGIRRLGRERPKVRLAVSLGSARPEVRRNLMPIDRAHPLADVVDACIDHARRTDLAPLWALTPLKGIHDDDAEVRALADLTHDFARRAGTRPRVTLVPYNPIAPVGEDPYERLDATAETHLRNALRAAGVVTHKRYSGGSDMAAACGQLAGARPMVPPVSAPATPVT